MKLNPFNYPSISFDLFVELQRLNSNPFEEFRFVPSRNPAYDLLQYRWRDSSVDFPFWRTFACVPASDVLKIKEAFSI